MRHLEFSWPSDAAATLVLLGEDNHAVVKTYDSCASFRTIEFEGRIYRHQGRDRSTGEMVYLPEVELV